MRQVIGLTSTYSSDEFGICSALFELGGMVVMHDASGCNSTYTTHDEPRWYDTESMIYISAISEMEAILGDDDKFIGDLIETARTLRPKFIALVGAPIPYMIGTDLEAIGRVVEEATGIPTMGFAANGMNYYTKGVSMALRAVLERFAERTPQQNLSPSVNILGATPLDFSLNGSVDRIRHWLEAEGYSVNACLSLGCSLEDVRKAGHAGLNLVVSYGGLEAARFLEKEFGIPYRVGVPYGDYDPLSESLMQQNASEAAAQEKTVTERPKQVLLIGESVNAASLGNALERAYKVTTKAACPVDLDPETLRPQDSSAPEEDDLMDAIKEAQIIIADPLYKSLVPADKTFIAWPHEAFSGRLYDKVNPDLIGDGLKRYFGETLC